MTRQEDIKLYTLTMDIGNPVKHLTFDTACRIAKELGVKKIIIEMED